MLITDQFVFIHMPKTGGTFVTATLKRIYEARARRSSWSRLRSGLRRGLGRPELRTSNKHGTCREIPARDQSKPLLATIRNPFDRYVSQYEFGRWRKLDPEQPNFRRVKHRFPRFPEISFPEYLELCHAMLPESLGSEQDRPGSQTWAFVQCFHRSPALEAFDSVLRSGLGSETDAEGFFPVRLLRTDRLNQDLHRGLQQLGYPGAEIDFILDEERIRPRASTRREDQKWQAYYSPELKARVRHWERLLLARFPEFDV